jgi:hypothetical protein
MLQAACDLISTIGAAIVEYVPRCAHLLAEAIQLDCDAPDRIGACSAHPSILPNRCVAAIIVPPSAKRKTPARKDVGGGRFEKSCFAPE